MTTTMIYSGHTVKVIARAGDGVTIEFPNTDGEFQYRSGRHLVDPAYRNGERRVVPIASLRRVGKEV